MIFINQSIGQLGLDIINYLNSRKIDVTVITGSKSSSHLDELGVKVIRLNSYNTKNYVTRFSSWFIFSLRCFFLLLKMKSGNKKILLTSNPPFNFLFSLINYYEAYFIVYDLYPNIIRYKFGPSLFVKFWEQLNYICFKKFEKIFSITNSLKIEVDKFILSSNKSIVIPVWSQSLIKSNFAEFESKYALIKEKKIFIYTGNFGITHNFDLLYEFITHSKISGFNNLFFLFVGYGSKKKEIVNFLEKNKIVNSLVLDFLPNEELGYLLSISYFGLVTLDKGMENFSIPSKTYSYLHHSLPILSFSSNGSELYDLILKNNVGYNYIEKFKFLNFLSSLNENPELYLKLKENACGLALSKYSVNNISLMFEYIYDNEEIN